MKLELKHLAGYLPYGLKTLTGWNNIEEIIGFKDETYFIKGGNVYAYGDIQDCKPILRPLSDLTKDEHFELYVDLCEEIGVVRCEHLLFALQDNLKYAFNLQDLNTLEDWMYKNHFDWKYNLIKNGLAIDINTINK